MFGIELEQCARCGGWLAVIASIEEPELLERILRIGGLNDLSALVRAAHKSPSVKAAG